MTILKPPHGTRPADDAIEGAAAGDLPALEPAELRRYARHLTLPEVGEEGQRKLKAARVLLVGAGGLGSPIGMYLAAAGVGTLGLVDFDRVDESNLQRQVLFGQPDLGRPKVEAAAERLAAINPHVRLEPHPVKIDSANALELVGGYDLVVDGSDNFPTRYLVNDACVLAGRADVYGSIFRFEGQVSVFWGERGPCYRCLFPEPPPPGMVPSCAEGGVLGVLPGIVGALQANEAIKLILGAGEPLVGRLVLIDALVLGFRELRLKKSPGCPVCSAEPTLTELIDYEAFCGLAGGDAAAAEEAADDAVPEIGVTELAGRLEGGEVPLLLDVRQPFEHRICRLPGAVLVPLPELERRLDELDRHRPIVAYCHTGRRSAAAVDLLRRAGFRATNLAGGIEAWSLEVDPTVPRY